jgi:leucyl-tRNA synthetase
VLFPIGWHVTGTPIIGAVERLKKGEEAQLSTLKESFNVPESDLQSLETPMGYARYFIEEGEASYKTGMRGLGLSIDWRREFTTNDDRYSKFITWQYESLRDRGLLEKGLHPVKYCTEQENPVTTHDLLEGEDVDYQEYTLIKFHTDDTVYPMATLRPETVRGVTNAYVDPEATYAEATVDGERWVTSAEAIEKLDLQDHEVTVEREFSGEQLVGTSVTNPVTDEEILILPADFVNPDSATGVVMSVPAHSPDDYVALQELKARADELQSHGIDPETVRNIEPVPILDIEGYGEIPAKDAAERAGIESSDDPELEEVTADLYQDEFHKGRLHEEYGEFAGEVIVDVRERLREHYQRQGAFATMYDFPEPVISRAGGKVVVAKQETWFLRYGDEDWKAKARRAVDNLTCIPENTVEQYEHTIDWLEAWPCIRNYGLGTRLPWDDDFVIEPLSDSTIYMSYYTIAHRIQDVPVEDLDRTFFDTLFYGSEAVENGEIPGVDEEREPSERALDLREEWEYWYPVDVRCSANDLIQNHLTFFLYHHAELFDEDNWPEGITVMGMGLLEGEKMSSSKGHVVLPGEAIERYGADTVRFFLLNSAEPWQDNDWRGELVGNTRDQLERFWNRAQELIESDVPEDPDLEHIDRWLLSKLQTTIRETTDSLEQFETRSASQTAFYQFQEHLKWYRRRADTQRPGAQWTLQEVLRTRLRLLAPFVPFMTNELHEQLTGEPAEDAPWPEPDPEREAKAVERREELVADLTEDIHDIVDVTGTDPETVRVFVAPAWKRDVFETVRDVGTDVGAVMGEVMQDEHLREKGDAVNDLVQDLVSFVREREAEDLDALSELDEQSVYADATDFLEREFDATVEVLPAEDADSEKADGAIPFRPAVLLE